MVASSSPESIRAFPNLYRMQGKPWPSAVPRLTGRGLPSLQSIETEATVNGKHALTISVAVGLAAIAGTIAATKTIHLGRPATTQPAAASSAIAHRTKQLDRAQIALTKALRQKPPKLPPLPAAMPAGGPSSTAVAAARQQRVIYVRPAPIVHTIHRAGGHEGDHEGGGGDGGGGFDD
jgi:hypothetical protein